MPSSDRRNEYARLEQELKRESVEHLLPKLQRGCGFLRRFRCWKEVLQFMHAGRSDDHGKDDVLAAILQAHARDQDHRWRAILFAIMWPAILARANRVRWWGWEESDQWANAYWAFMQTLLEWDATPAAPPLAAELAHRTRERLRNEYRREHRRSTRHRAVGLLCGKPDDSDAFDPDIEVEDPVSWVDESDGRIDQEMALRFLRRLCKAGYLTEPNFHILVGRHVYGQSLQEYAEAAGVTREAAKRRRSRADEALRAAVRKSPESVSPPAGSHGLLLVEAPEDQRGSRSKKA